LVLGVCLRRDGLAYRVSFEDRFRTAAHIIISPGDRAKQKHALATGRHTRVEHMLHGGAEGPEMPPEQAVAEVLKAETYV